MEEESFESEDIARLMNERFVPVKVDREERPDVDAIYMQAVQMLTQQGGWPMSVFLTPDRKPFFAGTYFPARDGQRGARVGFATLLLELDRVWREERSRATHSAEQIAQAVQHSLAADASTGAGQESPTGCSGRRRRDRSMFRDTRATTVVSQPPRFSTSLASALVSRSQVSCTASSASLIEPSSR